MKRYLIPFIILTLLVLTGCGHEPPAVDNAFRTEFSVNRDGTVYSGTLSRENGTVQIDMSEPYTVAGMSFTYRDGGLSLDLGTHSTTANSDYLPADSIPTVLYDALTYLPQATYTGSDNGADSFTLPAPYGDMTLTARSGVPTALTDPHTGMTFTFTEP